MLYVSDDKATVEAALKAAHDVLRGAGFSYKRIIQSAGYDRRYTFNGRTITLCGWHGTGTGNRSYGDGATVFSVYDSTAGYKPVFEIGGENHLNLYDFTRNGRCIYKDEAARHLVLNDLSELAGFVRDLLKK
jgi:hypothetical protein